MRALAVLFTLSVACAAQSHPQWWTYAEPNATALVGINWANLRGTVLAADVRVQIGPGGALRFPEVPCLGDAQQLLISGPDPLAIVAGACPGPSLREQAAAAKLRPSSYRGHALWISPVEEDLSLAVYADRLLFVGKVTALKEAIDRTQAEHRSYARLLARAARYANEDLWVVARRLPDDLASRFVPLDIRTLDFEGSVSLWEGLHLVSSITSSGIRAAEDLAGSLQAALEEYPELQEGAEVTLDRVDVYVKLNVTPDQLAALGHVAPADMPTSAVPATPVQAEESASKAPASSAAPTPAPSPSAPPPTPAEAHREVASVHVPLRADAATSETEPANPTGSAEQTAAVGEAPEPTASEPKQVVAEPKPKIIRIFGMGEKPLEIPMGKPR